MTRNCFGHRKVLAKPEQSHWTMDRSDASAFANLRSRSPHKSPILAAPLDSTTALLHAERSTNGSWPLSVNSRLNFIGMQGFARSLNRTNLRSLVAIEACTMSSSRLLSVGMAVTICQRFAMSEIARGRCNSSYPTIGFSTNSRTESNTCMKLASALKRLC